MSTQKGAAMPEIITPEEIDPNVAINEVDIEVYEEIGWRGFSEQLAQDAAQANASLAVITDAEGQFVCLATREMAEYLVPIINKSI